MVLNHIGMNLMEVKSNGIMIANDFHCPQEDEMWIEKILKKGENYNYRDLAILGDLNNIDCFSRFLKDKTASWDIEVEATKKLWRKLAGVFNRVWIIPGNHPKRVDKKTDNNWKFGELLKITIPEDIDLEINSTDRNYMVIIHEGTKWLCAHPKEYSMVIGRIAMKLSNAWDMNVIAAHSHTGSKTTWWENGNERVAIDNFCMCDPEKVTYLQEEVTSHPKWVRGFSMLSMGRLTIFTEGVVKNEESKISSHKGIKNGIERKIWG